MFEFQITVSPTTEESDSIKTDDNKSVPIFGKPIIITDDCCESCRKSPTQKPKVKQKSSRRHIFGACIVIIISCFIFYFLSRYLSCDGDSTSLYSPARSIAHGYLEEINPFTNITNSEELARRISERANWYIDEAPLIATWTFNDKSQLVAEFRPGLNDKQSLLLDFVFLDNNVPYSISHNDFDLVPYEPKESIASDCFTALNVHRNSTTFEELTKQISKQNKLYIDGVNLEAIWTFRDTSQIIAEFYPKGNEAEQILLLKNVQLDSGTPPSRTIESVNNETVESVNNKPKSSMARRSGENITAGQDDSFVQEMLDTEPDGVKKEISRQGTKRIVTFTYPDGSKRIITLSPKGYEGSEQGLLIDGTTVID